MTRVITTHVVDDLGGPGEATPLEFSVEGKQYTIDLNKRNRDFFYRRLERFLSAASEVPPGGRRAESAEIREWAASHGYTLASRGRIPSSVVAAWKEAVRD